MTRRDVLALLIALSCAAGTRTSEAQDAAARLQSAYRDLVSGGDFRVRVAAALMIGKSGDPGARPALEKALGDPHPAVRAAAAAALGAVGDAGAIAALRAAATKESTESVKAQLETTIKRLSQPAASGKPKCLVALGRIDARVAGVAPSVTSALKVKTRTGFGRLPAIELLAEGVDASAAGKGRALPVFLVDGTLTHLTKSEHDNDVGYAARVEYMIRKIPEQSLKGTISGRAEALADARSVRGSSELAQLQMDAVSAAVDSALKGAPIALEAASGKN